MTATSTITRKSTAEQSASVVTPERFSQGMDSFAAWMDAIELNKEAFQRHYDEFNLASADADALRALVQEHGVKALLLGEDWCP